MRVFVINLDRATERLAMFRDQSERLGFAFERVRAVDADSVDELPGSLRAAEVACFESHRATWRQFLDSGDPWCAIFEDDVHLSADIARFVASDDWIPAGASIIKLETVVFHTSVVSKGIPVGGGRKLHKLVSGYMGAGGYILGREAAARLLAATDQFTSPVDWVLFHPPSARPLGLVTFQLIPAACIQDSVLAKVEKRPVLHKTQIQHLRAPAEPRVARSRLLREVGRIASQAVDMVRRLLVFRERPSRLMKVKFR